MNTENKQVKSKKRVADHGEVFTSEREVNAMLDLVKDETERIDSRFLEPACGNGNFLAEILRRKLNVVDQKYIKNQFEWERYALIAVSSIYGVEILEDNANECRQRLYKIFEDRYIDNFKDNCKEELKRSILFILNRNILWGDALDFTNPSNKEPIVFSEWSPVNSFYIKRKDYVFRFLVENSFQDTLFDEDNEPKCFDVPVNDFPIIHFLKIGENDTSEL